MLSVVSLYVPGVCEKVCLRGSRARDWIQFARRKKKEVHVVRWIRININVDLPVFTFSRCSSPRTKRLKILEFFKGDEVAFGVGGNRQTLYMAEM